MRELLLIVILATSVGCGGGGDAEFYSTPPQSAPSLESSDATAAKSPSAAISNKEKQASEPGGEQEAVAEQVEESQKPEAEEQASASEAEQQEMAEEPVESQQAEAEELALASTSEVEQQEIAEEPAESEPEAEEQEVAEEPEESEPEAEEQEVAEEPEESEPEAEEQEVAEEPEESEPEAEEQEVAEEPAEPEAEEPEIEEIIDVETISDLCQDLENIVVSQDLVYPARSGCNFGQGENLTKLDRYLRAYETQSSSINIPEDSVLCDFSLESSSEDWRYDDFVMLTLNQKILISSNVTMVNNLTKTNDIYTWDWGQAQNTNLTSNFNAGPYCLEGTCEIPNHDQAGTVEIKLDSDTMLELASQISNNESVNFNLLSFGDNDNGDCEHTGLDLTVTYKYVLNP